MTAPATPVPALPPARPRFRQPTSRRGWLIVAAVGLVLGLAMIIENGTFPQGSRLTALVWLSAVLIVVCALLAYPLPFLGLAVAVGLCVANLTVPGMPHGGGTELIMLLFMVGFFAFRLPGGWSFGAWLIAAVTVGVSTALRGGEVFEVLFYLLFTAPGWLVGYLLQREKSEQAAVSAERGRIARELHDAVAHSVSVMTLQIGVVRRRLDTLPTEQDTLRQAERLGRQSVDELRRIVGLIRPDGPTLTPVPSLAQLDDLLDQVRSTGTTVDLERSGDPVELETALDVSAYRIIQEALTNAIKHAPGSSVRVRLAIEPDRLMITVSDDGPQVGAVSAGNGLTGMAERTAMFGGALSYGPARPRGFAVTAVLPTSPARLAESVR